MNPQGSFFGICDFSGRLRHELDLTNRFKVGAWRVLSDGPFTAFVSGANSDDVFIVDREDLIGIVHGELYGLETLTKNWMPGKQVGLASPGEIIAEAFSAVGSSCFPVLDGLFAAILWDRKRRKLIMYRDSSCVNFLYHASFSSTALAFSTDAMELFSSLGFPKRINSSSLHEYLRFLDISTANTVYDGVFSTEPGVPLFFDGKTLRKEQLNPRAPAQLKIGLEEAAIELNSILGESVKDRLEQNASTGFFLSGGVDSSLLLGLAAQQKGRDIQAFTVGFEGDRYDEMAVASQVANYLGVRHHELRFSMEQYRKELRRFLSKVDQPFADPAGLPTFLAMEKCGEHVEAMVDGTGADTLVGIMPARYSRIATQYASLLSSGLRSTLSQVVKFLPKLSGYRSLLDFEDPQEILIRWHGWRRREIEKLCGETVTFEHTRFYQVYARYGRTQHFERYSALMGNLPDDRIHQASRATHMRIRFPFWAPNVEAFIRSLPLNLRYAEGENKPILKAALAKNVPRRLWDVPKHGFDFPFRELMEKDNFSLIREHLDSREILLEGLIDSELARDCIDRFMRGDKTLSFRVWSLLVLGVWYAEHFA